MSTYNQLLHEYRNAFSEKGLSLETLRAFLYELCTEENVNLYLDIDFEAKASIEKKYRDGIKRLLNDEPMNYVLGYSYFYGYKMIVNNDVLIPRYETEELVGLILSHIDEYYKDQKEITVADIGTGSGAIAIALCKEEPKLKMYASDISQEAIEVAKQNALNNEANIKFFIGSMCDPIIENNLKLDILVSNPPYIKQDEILETSVKDYEPHLALFGGKDGLKFYREIFEKAKYVLKEKALMFFEMGYDQKENLTNLASSYFPNAEIKVYKDINKKDRMLVVKI